MEEHAKDWAINIFAYVRTSIQERLAHIQLKIVTRIRAKTVDLVVRSLMGILVHAWLDILEKIAIQISMNVNLLLVRITELALIRSMALNAAAPIIIMENFASTMMLARSSHVNMGNAKTREIRSYVNAIEATLEFVVIKMKTSAKNLTYARTVVLVLMYKVLITANVKKGILVLIVTTISMIASPIHARMEERALIKSMGMNADVESRTLERDVIILINATLIHV